jgi:hypothetical protein
MTSPLPNIFIAATARTPSIEFDFGARRLAISGEAYPEDAARFFGPLLQAMKDYLAYPPEGDIVFDLALRYFNSSSAKALMNLFDLLESAAATGWSVQINWHYAEADEAMLEFGEDFSQDFTACRFRLCPDAAG